MTPQTSSPMLQVDSCSLWIMVARIDVAFMMQTIPNLVRMCNHYFVEKVLAIDTASLSGEKAQRPHQRTIEQLYDCCERLKALGIIDKIITIEYSKKYHQKIYKKHFGIPWIKETHNYKGYPILGSMFCMEEAKGDYFLHFDSDMLLYQKKGFDWIAKGIDILNKYPEIMWIRPAAGPQTKANNIYDEYCAEKNSTGFYKLKGFSSRCYLIERRRFEKILPLKIIWAKKQGKKKDRLPRQFIKISNYITGSGILDSWENMVSESINRKSFYRADIFPENAWTLHPHTRSDEFINNLPLIIEKIEKGWFPKEQAGYYNLKLQYWV